MMDQKNFLMVNAARKGSASFAMRIATNSASL